MTCSQEALGAGAREERLPRTAQALHTLQTRVHLARNAVTVGQGHLCGEADETERPSWIYAH